MPNVDKLIPQGRGLAAALLKRATTLELDWAQRCGGGLDATDSQGRALHLALPPGSVLRGGDVLVAEDGSLIRVRAAAEPVLQVSACAEHGSPVDLLRTAYLLGARQVAVELQAEGLQLAPDAALAHELRARHLTVVEALAPFEPESGEAARGDHAHAQGSEPGHGQGPVRGKPVGIAVAAAPHRHGPGCGHDHP